MNGPFWTSPERPDGQSAPANKAHKLKLQIQLGSDVTRVSRAKSQVE